MSHRTGPGKKGAPGRQEDPEATGLSQSRDAVEFPSGCPVWVRSLHLSGNQGQLRGMPTSS